MNRSQSKYFNTAIRMDEAFLSILARKDFSNITVKEICEKAGVNRSTFYLHYETLSDLLNESVQYMHTQFVTYMKEHTVELESFTANRLHTGPLDDLYLITPEYLLPFLSYIKKNQKLFKTALENTGILQLEETYGQIFEPIFTPLLERFHVPEKDRPYLLAFYVRGLMAILQEWLKNECEDPIERIGALMEQCVQGAGMLGK
ncbi:TetR/AcrR family transcriptional regulator [Erysipelotrichaceae bacterium 51-3]